MKINDEIDKLRMILLKEQIVTEHMKQDFIRKGWELVENGK